MVNNEQWRSWKAAHLAENYGMGAARMADYGFHSRQAKLEAAPACVRWLVAQFPLASITDRRKAHLTRYAQWTVHVAFSDDGECRMNDWSRTDWRLSVNLYYDGSARVSVTEKGKYDESIFNVEGLQDDVPALVCDAMAELHKQLQESKV